MRRALSIAIDAFLVVVLLALVALQFGPRILPYRVYTVLSGSMAPAIPVGAEVVDTRVDATAIQVGDVITFPHPDHPDVLITHRVVHIVDRGPSRDFFTKGDANGAEDAWKIAATGSQLRVLFVVPLAGYLLSALGSPLAHVLLVAAVAVAGVIFLVDLWTRR